MSAQKISSNLGFQPEDMAILKTINDVLEEASSYADVIGSVTKHDCVAQNLEEITMLVEFRRSKFNYRLNKINTLKKQINKSFK
jgi:hypothetical protein